MKGWISIYRKIEEWEWYSDTITFRIFFQLLLQANHESVLYKGQKINRGQTLTSYKQLIERIGDKKITIQQTRTAINHLKSTGEITTQSTGNGLLVTIEKYDLYQTEKEKTTGKTTEELTFNQQTVNSLPNIQITPNNNDNNINKYNNILLYFINKYKKEKPKNMFEYIKINKAMRNDKNWILLNNEQQMMLLAK